MDTSTGLVAVIPTFIKKEGRVLSRASIQKAHDVVQTCQEVVRSLIVDEADAHSENYFELLKLILNRISAIEKKEGEDFRYILFVNPWFDDFNSLCVMETFQRLMIDGFAHGIELRSTLSAQLPLLALLRRSAVEDYLSDPIKARIIPYEYPSGN